ncbi:MAG: DNA polymerase III subunit gamma/tau [Muribaculaceae bacterium]|nr:DNA polymerase III subunit gamma/tau [Muribaculaceae bacterium]
MSEQYIVSARKYRPTTFASVVGQKGLTTTLKNAIETGRLAQAYLFTGPRGVGKTSCARIFARTINCLSPTADGEACGLCDSCRAINDGNSMNIIELDAASNNSVHDIRAIGEQVNIPPQIGKYRVFIIDEVHMLTTQAFNAFLKTLEEPPKYVIFILATTEKHKVIPTILSRCQIYDFKRITIPDIVEHLRYVAGQEGISAEVSALNVIARKADGAMRDALSIFDQVAASCEGNITYERTIANLNVLDYEYYFRLIESFRAGNVQESLLIYKEIRDKGFDSLFFVGGLSSHIRDLMVAADPATLPLLEVAEEVASRYSEQAKSLPVQWYYVAMKLLNDCDLQYRTATNKQFLVELTLIRLCQLLKPLEPPFDRVDAEIPLRVATSPRTAVPEPPASTSSTPTPSAPAPSVAASRASSPASPVHTSVMNDIPRTSRGGNRPGMGMRLSSVKTQAVAETAFHEKKREAVNLEGFKESWARFIAGCNDRPMLQSALRSMLPEQTGPESFKVIVKSLHELETLRSGKDALLQHIRKEINNDFITLETEIKTENIEKRLPPAELLKEMLGKNPELAQFLRDNDAELV